MTDYEILQIIIQITQLRSGPEYQKAVRIAYQYGPEHMASADHNSEQYAAIRLLIGTWIRIGIITSQVEPEQLPKVHQCNPVRLMRDFLQPAIEKIRSQADMGNGYASEFDGLASAYDSWANTPAGRAYTSMQTPPMHAMFG